MSRALIRSGSAIAAAALLLLAGGAIPAAASTVQDQSLTIPAPDQVSQVIPVSEVMAAMIGGLDLGAADAEAESGGRLDLSGVGLLVFGPALAAVMYEYQRGYFPAGS